MVRITKEDFQWKDSLSAKSYKNHISKTRKNLLFNMLLLVATVYALLFVGGFLKWPILLVFAFIYFERNW